jgi:hypothetical protein
LSNRISFIELEVKKCTRVYGSSPCTAAVGVTGDQKCFNSRATCQDLPNILEANESVRLAKPSSIKPDDINSTPYIENIESISYTPPVLDLGRSIGVRASLSVSFKDHRSPDSDATGDPYLGDRNYDPYTLGTYFGKLKARHPFLRGQSIYWVQGTDSQEFAAMERRHFIVEETTGPNSSGTYSITAKDALKLTQGDRALAPKSSQGYLVNQITAAQSTPFTVVLSPFGIGNIDYPASGTAAIGGKEIVTFTRSGDSLTITARAQSNTEAAAHEPEDRVQLCLKYSSQSAPTILNSLLTNYTEIPSSYIPLADWTVESDIYLARLYSTVIAEPTPINILVNEILEQTGSNMWWDSSSSLIRWSVLKDTDPSAFEFNESNYLQGSFNIADQFNKRVSRVIVNYGQINPLLNLNDERNYASSLLNVDLDSEAFFNNTPAYKNIFSRWIDGDLRDTAGFVASLILQRYASPPRKVGFTILRDSIGLMPELSGSYNLKNLYIQDFTGAQKIMPIQVTSVNPGDSIITVNAEEVTFTEIIQPVQNVVNLFPTPDYIGYNIYDRTVVDLGGAPIAATVVNVFVSENFILGSMTTGSGWPVGATINLYVQPGAKILGPGGTGGIGGSAIATVELKNRALSYPPFSEPYFVITANTTTSPTSGTAGGTALEIFHPVNITNYGIIGGGGGGAGGSGGAAAAFTFAPEYKGYQTTLAAIGGHGGGGGAGYPGGTGGRAGTQDAYAFKKVFTGPGDFTIDRYDESSLFLGPITEPSPAGDGSILLGGLDKAIAFQNGYKPLDYPASTSIIEAFAKSPNSGFASGHGGDLGATGQAGGDGFSEWSFTALTKDSYSGVDNAENGAAFGAAGAAINTNGNTVTYLITGDIRGAII